ncbi:MAG: FecR domain-containing protein [Bryobacterales bacterium]|nr:FecR domain-containing protein [Bryobacterales bacterium]
MTDQQFDDLLNEMRDERAPEAQSAEARQRVWQQIAHTTSLACAEFRPEFGAYRAGELSAARRLLLDDHLARCADCRHILDGSAQAPRVVAMPEPRRRALPARWLSYAAAAALYMTRDNIDRALAPSGPRATIASIDGTLHNIPGDALSAGATLSEGELVRTGAGSRAILTLADGSRLELNQRTELSLSAAWSGQTVRLHHGDLIVQAAKQRRGHLRVVTRDSVASVKGTIFAVSSGSPARSSPSSKALSTSPSPANTPSSPPANSRPPPPPSPRSPSASPLPGARKLRSTSPSSPNSPASNNNSPRFPPPPRAPKPSSSATSPPPPSSTSPSPTSTAPSAKPSASSKTAPAPTPPSAIGGTPTTAATSATPSTACRPSCPSSAMRSSSSSPPPPMANTRPSCSPRSPLTAKPASPRPSTASPPISKASSPSKSPTASS